ncbi:hypothetical protein JKP88DRAFT_157547 [Tribonema minus]|uniref:DNA sliding clamp PCNA n=1 Tax=Tribonema minus TaxID=303371 RepID=A0A835YX88_9STRA|nr:hypothetical protein JKP88DRAFT_157547 [Tribonema minus]
MVSGASSAPAPALSVPPEASSVAAPAPPANPAPRAEVVDPPAPAPAGEDAAAAVACPTDEAVPEGILVCMRTHHTQQWRTLTDALKDLISESPVTFGPAGMKLVSMDPAHVALVNLQIQSEHYYCKREITVGLNVAALYKMLRNLTTGGYILELSLSEDDPDHLRVLISNEDKRTRTSNRPKLLRLPDEIITIPPAVFQRVLSIPSADFQRYIRELSGVSNKIKIRSTRDVLVLSAEGTSGSTEIEIRPTASGMHWQFIDSEATDEVVEGVFYSRYVERFARPLDSVVEIFIKQAYPLVLRYQLQAATVRLVIAQCTDDDAGGEGGSAKAAK